MTFGELQRVWRADLHRYVGRSDARTLARALIVLPGYRYTFAMRACRYVTERWPGAAVRALAQLLLRRYEYRYGITIPFETQVGEGLYIGHFGAIVVSHRAVIGRNCNLSQGVTLGIANRGSRRGAPVIGDGVYVGPGAKIVGAVTVGDNVAIGANSVVTKDVPDNAVVVGVPARVISHDGAADYVTHTDY
ncbi:MAG: serine O-acetyltransferase [Thermoleophilaceae bacterium]|nr:serine O-acetyltransferase [Thermoleophilaceae bacterium]